MKPLYYPKFLTSPETYLQPLLGLEWLSVTDARKEYFMSDEPRSYTYGQGEFAREYHSREYSEEVASIRDELNADGSGYNVCFLNRYDNQRNQLGWHSDDSPMMDGDHPIAVVSFGVEREIWWRKIGDKGETPKENRKLLASGSLFIMPAGFQSTHQHRIPKCDRECGVRISLTLRRYKGESAPQSMRLPKGVLIADADRTVRELDFDIGESGA